jgi:hypothetical protein
MFGFFISLNIIDSKRKIRGHKENSTVINRIKTYRINMTE